MADPEVSADPILENLAAQLQEVQDAIVEVWNQSDAMQHSSADRLAVFRELCESQRIIAATMHDHHIFIAKHSPGMTPAADAEKTG